MGDEPRSHQWYRQAKETKRGEMGGRESQRLIVPMSQGNHPEGTLGREGDASYEPLEGNMIGTPRPATVFTKQQRIAELARNGPEMAFTTLAHHIDINWMHMAYAQTRKDGAVGVDGQTAADYENNLMGNLQDLLDRAKAGTYVAPPVRRVHIPKAGSPNETRPLGIPTFEDKILQRAVLMVLEPVYETDFLDASHGFRPGRGAHGALDSLWKQAMNLGCCWIVDVDLRKFFDTIDHGHLREFLKRRVRDGVILRLIGKWLNAGVLEDGVLTTPEHGTPQGGVVTPPTMWQTSLLGASLKRGWTDPIHDADLLLVDLDSLHQGPNNFSSRLPTRLVQLLGNASGELLQLADHQPQFHFLVGLVNPLPTLILQLGQALARCQDPRLEFRLVEQPVAVGIDQS